MLQRAREAVVAAGVQDPSKEQVLSPKILNTDLLSTLEYEEMVARETASGRVLPRIEAGSTVRVSYIESITQKAHPRTFVGICIGKRNCKLGSSFTLRNSIEGEGVEATFRQYDPLIQSVEVLRLARRRRAKLYYLRSRPGRESAVGFDVVAHPSTGKIPVDKAK